VPQRIERRSLPLKNVSFEVLFLKSKFTKKSKLKLVFVLTLFFLTLDNKFICSIFNEVWCKSHFKVTRTIQIEYVHSIDKNGREDRIFYQCPKMEFWHLGMCKQRVCTESDGNSKMLDYRGA
jgi:hypothetical protein